MSINRATLLVGAASVLCAAGLLVGSGWPIWLRALIGIPFILLLPGQAAMLTVDPDSRLDIFESFALALGLSISVTMVLGVALASTVGLTPGGMIVSLASVTVAALVVANIRPDALAEGARPLTRRNPGWRAVLGTLVLVGCALLILAISIPNASVVQDRPTVQLWGLPDPLHDGVRIGANNINARSVRYELTVTQGDRTISRQKFEMKAGTAHIFVVRKSALWTTTGPVVAVLADTSNVVPARTISVWATE